METRSVVVISISRTYRRDQLTDLLFSLRKNVKSADMKKSQNSTEWFSVCPNITSKFRTIAVFKSFDKQSNDSDVGMSTTAQNFIYLT
jgi:hypothetical protein